MRDVLPHRRGPEYGARAGHEHRNFYHVDSALRDSGRLPASLLAPEQDLRHRGTRRSDRIQSVKTYVLGVLLIACLAWAQQNSQKTDTPPPADQKQDSTPLFQKKLDVKSSKTTKESTTLGFNGIDPSGKVDQKMLATSPTAADQDKVKKMSANQPSAADLKGFLKQGGLNTK